ncbi:hypothetical protein P691DRAFT_787858 [Macrolepiota fuliginosa MF-IS2]|uniref:Uncharacterized protein n=1 Tax=Macrolepiota fuliginosa MF-IS2 TaxID=1400762 RepID=A0A9P6BZN1_9AGAR|nr:hypothetical protein P691DRAFT_787858 [Macrolepiota fuliginosa MF-IS2]
MVRGTEKEWKQELMGKVDDRVRLNIPIWPFPTPAGVGTPTIEPTTQLDLSLDKVGAGIEQSTGERRVWGQQRSVRRTEQGFKATYPPPKASHKGKHSHSTGNPQLVGILDSLPRGRFSTSLVPTLNPSSTPNIAPLKSWILVDNLDLATLYLEERVVALVEKVENPRKHRPRGSTVEYRVA